MAPIDGGTLQFVQQPRKIPLVLTHWVKIAHRNTPSLTYTSGQGTIPASTQGREVAAPLKPRRRISPAKTIFEIACNSFPVPSWFQEPVSTVADRLPHNAGWSATHSLRTAPWASHHLPRQTRRVLWSFETGSMRQWPTRCGCSTTNWPRATI